MVNIKKNGLENVNTLHYSNELVDTIIMKKKKQYAQISMKVTISIVPYPNCLSLFMLCSEMYPTVSERVLFRITLL